MMSSRVGIRSWITVVVLAVVFATVAVSSVSTTERAPSRLPLHHDEQEDRRQEEERRQQAAPPLSPPSLLLSFTTPINGSRVEGPDVKIHYKIFSTDGTSGNRELARDEVRDLAETTTVCFKLHGFSDPPEICAPLRLSTVTIRDALPAKWHTVTSSIKNTETGELLGGSSSGLSVFNNLNGFGVLDMCGESACLDSRDLRAAYFDYVYRHPYWSGYVNAASRSKVSSTISIRSALAGVLSAFNIKSMLDAPCGDLTWMPLVEGIQNVRYMGVDIVEAAVEKNRRKFAPSPSESWAAYGAEVDDDEAKEAELGQEVAAAMRRGEGLRDPVFQAVDLVDAVPASQDGNPFDLVFVRDLMVHLPARHNLRVIHNIQSSGARFLMASTYVSADENGASESFVPLMGHNINLSLPPYCLPEPLAVFVDDSTDRNDLRMGLWDLHQDTPLALSGDCLPMSATT